MSKKGNKIKTLFFDIETKPVLAWTFRIGPKVSLYHDNLKEGEKFDIICICYKWAGESKVHTLTWNMKTQDSSKMVEEFTKVVESADLVIGHNGDRFDIKQVNTQRLLHNQPAISWPTSEDTLKQLRSKFAFPSNKLDYITKTLFGAGKDKMSLQDWVDIVEKKSQGALDKMTKYCRRDVVLLEKTFNSIKAHCKPKFSVAVSISDCPRCGSTKTRSKGLKRTNTRTYQQRVCMSCNHAFQGPRVLGRENLLK